MTKVLHNVCDICGKDRLWNGIAGWAVLKLKPKTEDDKKTLLFQEYYKNYRQYSSKMDICYVCTKEFIAWLANRKRKELQ